MSFYKVLVEVETDNGAEWAAQEVIGIAQNYFEDWDIKSVELSEDQGDDEADEEASA